MDKIIKADNHEEDVLLIFERLRGIPKKGIIHVGAHLGEEVDNYFKLGFENIVLIEANPSLCEKMNFKYRFNKNVFIYNYAVCDSVGELDFYIHQSNSGIESSSILKMDRFDKIVTSLKTSKTIKVPSSTLDAIIIENNLEICDYNILVTDIQGADYLALKGFKNKITNFDAVVVEIQCINLYENFVSEQMMDDLMFKYGFYKDFVIYHELYENNKYFPAWGEVVYINNKFKFERKQG